MCRMSMFLFAIYQDIQTDAPFHLMRLKVEVEKDKLMGLLQDCQAELTRENRHLPSMGSERLVKEHRVNIEWGLNKLYAHLIKCLLRNTC